MNSAKVKILIVGIIMALVFLLIIIPKFMRARSLAHTNSCINHLVQIDGAKQMWAKENNKKSNDVPTWNDLRAYLGTVHDSTILACPDGGTYTIGRVADAPKCSIRGHALTY